MDGSWECLTEAVSSAVNAHSSELWLAAEVEEPHSTCPPSRPVTNPAGGTACQRTPVHRSACISRSGRSASPPPCAPTSFAFPAAVRHKQRLNARCGSRNHRQRTVMPWLSNDVSAGRPHDGRRSVRCHGGGALWPAAEGGRGTAGSDQQSLGSSAGIWPAEANQLRTSSDRVDVTASRNVRIWLERICYRCELN